MFFLQYVEAQAPAENTGPLNPLVTELHIQGMHEDGVEPMIIFFQPADAFEGQLDSLVGARITAVGPITFEGDAYVIVPKDVGYTPESTGFMGTFITYDPNETTARNTLNLWLDNEMGWYLVEGDNAQVLQVVTDEAPERYETNTLNELWAETYDVRVGTYVDSIFSSIDIHVQNIFWRFYVGRLIPDNMQELWSWWRDLKGALEEVIAEEYWSERVRTYLRNYRKLLNIWCNAFNTRRLLNPVDIQPLTLRDDMGRAINEAFQQIGETLEDAGTYSLWPTGRVRVLDSEVRFDEIRWAPRPAAEALRAPISTSFGGYECPF